MIDPAKVCFYIPPVLSPFKRELFDRVGRSIESFGGRVVEADVQALAELPDDITPIVGCMLEVAPLIAKWRATKRQWIYWDRGYVRRVFAAWLPRGEQGGMYRWQVNSYQMQTIRDVPSDRWDRLVPGNRVDPRPIEIRPWVTEGKHIVLAQPSLPYARFHGIEGWTERTIYKLRRMIKTQRKIVVRDKESKRSLQDDLAGAHCLVTHGSIAAVEAVICGCPVFVHADSAASLVGATKLKSIEQPIYPDRKVWMMSLAYHQFNEQELVDGTLWRLIE